MLKGISYRQNFSNNLRWIFEGIPEGTLGDTFVLRTILWKIPGEIYFLNEPLETWKN